MSDDQDLPVAVTILLAISLTLVAVAGIIFLHPHWN